MQSKKEENKVLAVVKWYGSRAKEIPYGFANCPDLGTDVFIHRNQLLADVGSLKEGDVVVCSVRESERHPGKRDAYDVHLLRDERDLWILLQKYAELVFRHEFHDGGRDWQFLLGQVQVIVAERLNEVDPDDLIVEEVNYPVFVGELVCEWKKKGNHEALIKSCVVLLGRNGDPIIGGFDETLAAIYSACDSTTRVMLWLEGYGSEDDLSIVSAFHELSAGIQERVVGKCSPALLQRLINKHLRDLGPKASYEKLSEIERTLKFSKRLELDFQRSVIEKIAAVASPILSYTLWRSGMDEFWSNGIAPFIATEILDPDGSLSASTAGRLTAEKLIAVLKSAISRVSTLAGDAQLSVARKIANLLRSLPPDAAASHLQILVAACSPDAQLKLWVHDDVGLFSFDTHLLFVGQLSVGEQRRCVKKIFRCTRERGLGITYGEIEKLARVEPRMEYSTDLVLETLLTLARGKKVDEKRIYEIILHGIKSPSDILHVEGYFESCEGRQAVSKANEIRDSNGVVAKRVPTVFRGLGVPAHVKYCEGQKAIDKRTRRPALSKKELAEFWWCRNWPCFQACQEGHSSSDWERFTLRDFIEILNLKYVPDEYYQFLGLLNKVNQVLEHMKCRECGQILRPSKSSNYAFYRVSTFRCSNPSCEFCKEGTEVYISHCLNGRCNNTIDSRDSKQGPCGWYICSNCLACCNTPAIDRRNHFRESTGQSPIQQTIGHQELRQIYCHKCGSEVLMPSKKSHDYERILAAFRSNAAKKNGMIKSGTRKDGGSWFLIGQPANMTNEEFLERLRHYRSIGFEVPALEKGHRSTFLIGEPRGIDRKLAVCSNPKCDMVISLNDIDLARKQALRYHAAIDESFAQRSES